MGYERVGKEALYFSKEEIELLRSCGFFAPANFTPYIHTSGIIFMFWNDEDTNIDNPRYLYLRQLGYNSEFIKTGIVDDAQKCLVADFTGWQNLDLYSLSVIRVG